MWSDIRRWTTIVMVMWMWQSGSLVWAWGWVAAAWSGVYNSIMVTVGWDRPCWVHSGTSRRVSRFSIQGVPANIIITLRQKSLNMQFLLSVFALTVDVAQMISLLVIAQCRITCFVAMGFLKLRDCYVRTTLLGSINTVSLCKICLEVILNSNGFIQKKLNNASCKNMLPCAH